MSSCTAVQLVHDDLNEPTNTNAVATTSSSAKVLTYSFSPVSETLGLQDNLPKRQESSSMGQTPYLNGQGFTPMVSNPFTFAGLTVYDGLHLVSRRSAFEEGYLASQLNATRGWFNNQHLSFVPPLYEPCWLSPGHLDNSQHTMMPQMGAFGVDWPDCTGSSLPHSQVPYQGLDTPFDLDAFLGNSHPPTSTPMNGLLPAVTQVVSTPAANSSTDDTSDSVYDGTIRCRHGCPGSFRRPGDYRRHLRKHEQPRFKCPKFDCDKTFYRADKMRDHVRQGHKGLLV